MQPEKRVYTLQYKENQIPKKLSLDQSIDKIITLAKGLFHCADEEQFFLFVNGKEVQEECLLSELKLELEASPILELIEKIPSTAKDLIFFTIRNKPKTFDWQGSLSRPISEALKTYYSTNGLDASSFELFIDGKPLKDTTILDEIPDIEDAVVDLAQTTKEMKQEGRIQEEEEKIEEKEILFIFNENRNHKLVLNWKAPIKSLKLLVAEVASVPSEAFQMWSINEGELEDEKSLCSQLGEDDDTIQVQLLKFAKLKIISRAEQFELLVPIYPFYSIQELKTKFEKEIKISSINQIWYHSRSEERLKNDAKLVNYVEDSEDPKLTIVITDFSETLIPDSKRKLNEKKVFTLQHKGEFIKKFFSIGEEISFVHQVMMKYFKISDENQLILLFKEDPLDLNKRLSDYMSGPVEPIQVKILSHQENLIKVVLLYKEEHHEIQVKKETSIKEIKDLACSHFKAEPSYLYSIFFDRNILQPKTLLQDVQDLEEDSVFDLISKVKLSFILPYPDQSQQDGLPNIVFDPASSIDELKMQVLDAKIFRDQKFYLKFADKQLEGCSPLSAYLYNDDPISLTIHQCENEKDQPKINIIFNKLPENDEFRLSIFKTENFVDLTGVLDQRFKINKLKQSWRFKDQFILNQSNWEELISTFSEMDDLVIDIFECARPFEQEAHIVRYQSNNVTRESRIFNLMKSVAQLKQEAANDLKLSENHYQSWRINSTELEDNLPFAVQCKFTENEILRIFIRPYHREFTLFFEGESQVIEMDLYSNMLKLKETLFKENKVTVSPEKQLWSLDNSYSYILEDHQIFSFYLLNPVQNELWIREKDLLLKIKFTGSVDQTEEVFDVDVDPNLLIGEAKEKARSRLKMTPEEQCWLIDQTEVKNQCRIKDCIASQGCNFVNIELKRRVKFYLTDGANAFEVYLFQTSKVGDLKKEIKETGRDLEIEKIQLKVNGKRLEDDRELQDCFSIGANLATFIQIKKAPILIIKFLNNERLFYLNGQITVPILMREIEKVFSLKNSEFRLKEGDQEKNNKDLKEILQNEFDTTLTCYKLKTLSIIYEDLEEKDNEILIIDAHISMSSLFTGAANKLNISVEECFFIHNENSYSNREEVCLDNLDPESAKIELRVRTAKKLKVQRLERSFTINYLPSETIEIIKKRLFSQGFNDISDFSLQKNNEQLLDDQTLSFYGIKYGRHTIDGIFKRKMTVMIKGEEHTFICGEKIESVEDLKKYIKEHHNMNIEKQLLILMNSDEWHRVLNRNDEILADVKTDNPKHINILCKTMKKFPIKLGSQTKSEDFEGLFSSLEDQKKLLKLKQNIPVEEQVWLTRKNKKLEPVDGQEFLEKLENGLYDVSNAIQIFRKINLSICLNEEWHELKDLSTHETVRMQKDKVNDLLSILAQNQSLFYEEKELEDDRMLDEYFTMTECVNQNNSYYPLDLIVHEDLEYFGFTEKSEINKDIFQKFLIESDKDLDIIIKEVHFNKKEASLQFRNKLLGLFFSSLKKHSLWESLISKIKKRTYDLRAINLWENHERHRAQKSHFNTQFLLYYFLNSGTPELNIEILRIMKLHFPVPLVINTWSNRFSVEGNKILNELYWVMQKSFIVTSFGFGGAESQACGKSSLNNRLLNSNFVLSTERNQICKECPEIAFDIYKNNKFPINLIDIPSGTDEEIKNKIISSSNMLIIHSLIDEEATRKDIQSRFHGIPVIVIYRDCQNAFSNVSSFRQSLIKSYAIALTTRVFETRIVEEPNYSQSNELSDLAEKVNEYILQTFQTLKDDQELWKFFKFYENHNQSVHAVFDQIGENSSQVIQAIPMFEFIQRTEKSHEPERKREADNRLQNYFKNNPLSLEMMKIIEILRASDTLLESKQNGKPSLILEQLQEYLRMVKSQQTMDFYKLYEFKSLVSECSSKTEQKVLEDFAKYWEIVKKQDRNFSEFQIPSLSKGETFNFIEACLEIFEQKIIPNIFSIELFWRELIYFNRLKQIHQIKLKEISANQDNSAESHIDNFLVSLKKENILNSYPFEIIDGDLLYMPKEFYKTTFKDMNDRVIVISVLGPQSSGKSTLLNFLFGCNFVTSSGRCTKGVYGTYFKVSNFDSCDGILVLDTEGLFGLLNKKDEQNRERFDMKLALFCLAMSDFVFINFKGDIDRHLTEVLMVCKDSLKRLKQGNVQIPEMFLILNQNTQTNIDTQLQDIDKMGDLGFSRANVEVLPLAFETSTNKSAAVARFMEPVMKKTPKIEFSEKCSLLTSKLFEKISRDIDSSKQRTLEGIIDKMEHLWEMFNKFPHLVRPHTLIDQEREKLIKEWIEREVDGTFKNKIGELVDNLKKSENIKLDWENEFYDKFNEESRVVINLFYKSFEQNTREYLFKELESVLYAHIDRIKIGKRGELTMQSYQEKIKVYDAQGNETIRAEAYKIKGLPNISEKEKDEKFEEIWQTVMSNVEKNFDKRKESETLFKTVVDNYRANINKSTGALPTLNFPDANFIFEEYQDKLRENVCKEYAGGQCFEYTAQPPALIFRGGKTNVSGEYFNLKRYFTEVEVDETFGLSRQRLSEIFDIHKIRKELNKNQTLNQREDDILKKLISQIQKELKLFGVSVHEKVLEIKVKKNFSYGKWNPWIQIDSKYEEYSKKTHEVHTGIQSYTSHYNHLDSPNFGFIDHDAVFRFKQELFSKKSTHKCFFEKIFQSAIKWDVINKSFDSEIEALYREHPPKDLIAKIQDDLAKINLTLIDSEALLEFVRKDPSNLSKLNLIHSITFNANLANQPLNRAMKPKIVAGLSSQGKQTAKVAPKEKVSLFKFLREDFIQQIRQKMENIDDSQYLLIQKYRGAKRVVKKEYEHIAWLGHYADETTNQFFANTIEDKDLCGFVFREFNFQKLIIDIFKVCLKNVSKNSNFSSPLLYQNIVRQVNDCIGAANNDLQQTAYRLEYELIGHIHATAVHLIWKHFEEIHWNNISKPIKDTEKRKEQQRIFFKSIASSDLKKSNEAEAGRVKQFMDDYIHRKIAFKEKQRIINETSQKFKTETKRKNIQEEIDSNYFSRNSKASVDEVYYYVLNPSEVILQTYEKRSQDAFSQIKIQLGKVNSESNLKLDYLLERLTSFHTLLSQLKEEFWNLENIFEFTEYSALEKNEIGVSEYSYELGGIYYKIIIGFLKGIDPKERSHYEINAQAKVIVKTINTLPISNPRNDIIGILNHLSLQAGKVTNAKLFVESLIQQVEQLKLDSNKWFEFDEEDRKTFEDQINIFVCKEKCPCCDRICGEEDPHHNTHQCLYGHQIRAIGGTMLRTNEASVARCEDIGDTDIILFNGQEMNWAAFKENMRNQQNNPWSFDDLTHTREDKRIQAKFGIAWEIIGERICTETYASQNMIYVPYNQTMIQKQKLKPTSYIYMIDTSSSMKGDKWKELKASLKVTLEKIGTLNPENRVTILNFSKSVIIDYQNADSNAINVESLKFQSSGTKFNVVFKSALEQLKSITKNDIVLVFMTDGDDSYPKDEMAEIQRYKNSDTFKKLGLTFDFYAVAFKCKSDLLKKMAEELGGITYFPLDEAQLTKNFMEILNKKQ